MDMDITENSGVPSTPKPGPKKPAAPRKPAPAGTQPKPRPAPAVPAKKPEVAPPRKTLELPRPDPPVVKIEQQEEQQEQIQPMDMDREAFVQQMADDMAPRPGETFQVPRGAHEDDPLRGLLEEQQQRQQQQQQQHHKLADTPAAARLLIEPDMMQLYEPCELWTYKASGPMIHSRRGLVISKPADWDDAQDMVRAGTASASGGGGPIEVSLTPITTEHAFSWPMHNLDMATSKAEYRTHKISSASGGARPQLWTAFIRREEMDSVHLSCGEYVPAALQDCDQYECGWGQVFCAVAISHHQAMELLLHLCEMLYCSAVSPNSLAEQGVMHPLYQLLEQRIERFELVPCCLGW